MRRFKIVLIFIFLFILLLPYKYTNAYSKEARIPLPSSPEENDLETNIPSESQAYIGIDPSVVNSEVNIESEETRSLSNSFVVLDPSAGGDGYYNPYESQTFCFRSETFTNDWEYVYANWLKFPSDWIVSDIYVQGTPSCTYFGQWGPFSWEFQTNAYEVKINHYRYHTQDSHCVATYCVELTSAPSTDPASVSWFFEGNGNGSEPHYPCSWDGYAPTGYTCDESINPPSYIREAKTGEWVDIGLGDGCPDWYRYDAEFYEETGMAYLMGGRSDTITEGDIYSFNPETGTCLDTNVDMLTPVSNYYIARLEFSDGERLCTFGGYNSNSLTNTNKVQCYSPILNNIEYKADLPLEYDGYRPGGVEVVNNKAYLFGGLRTTTPYNTAITYEYNPQTNSYTLKGNMSLNRHSIISAVSDDMIYAFGGNIYDGTYLITQTKAERFDPVSGTWSDITVPDLLSPLGEGQAFGFDQESECNISGAIVIVGGGQWPDSSAEALLYNLDSKTYDYSFGDLNVQRRNHAGFFQPGEKPRMWVIGGRINEDYPPYGTAEYYGLEPRHDIYLPLILDN